MATLTKIYSDIDFTFTKRPVVGDIALSYDAMAVIRSIRNLILTKHYETPWSPERGSNIDAFLFEPISTLTGSSIEREIETIITNYEPRAILQSIEASPNPDQNSYSLTITFYLENSATPTTVTLILERNR